MTNWFQTDEYLHFYESLGFVEDSHVGDGM